MNFHRQRPTSPPVDDDSAPPPLPAKAAKEGGRNLRRTKRAGFSLPATPTSAGGGAVAQPDARKFPSPLPPLSSAPVEEVEGESERDRIVQGWCASLRLLWPVLTKRALARVVTSCLCLCVCRPVHTGSTRRAAAPTHSICASSSSTAGESAAVLT